MDLGKRIRGLRKERGLSLGQLADKSGVAIGTLSRMENDKGTGTFRTHQRIADALGISITDLYRGLEESEQEAVLTKPESEEVQTFLYDEKASALLLTSQVTSKKMLPQMLILQSGGKTALEQYRKGTERWLFCMEGELNVKVGEKDYQIPPGGTLYLKASIPHQLLNTNPSVTRIISVTTPVSL